MVNKLVDLEESREWLIDAYIKEKKSYRTICKELKISKRTLQLYLKKFDIPARKRGGSRGRQKN